jgi:hypothetical protein
MQRKVLSYPYLFIHSVYGESSIYMINLRYNHSPMSHCRSYETNQNKLQKKSNLLDLAYPRLCPFAAGSSYETNQNKITKKIKSIRSYLSWPMFLFGSHETNQNKITKKIKSVRPLLILVYIPLVAVMRQINTKL